MYTINSKYVSEQDKLKITEMVLDIRPYVSTMIDNAKDCKFSDGKELDGNYLYKDDRYYDSEQVFQAFCQNFIRSEQDADNLGSVIADDKRLKEMVVRALLNAASCDHWYCFEKDYD